MTSEETRKILFTINEVFENFRVDDPELKVNVWCDMLSDYTYQEVSTALKTYIQTSTSQFAPSIGQLIDIIHKIKGRINGEKPEAEEAWAIVYKAICRASLYATDDFEKFSPVIKRAVGSAQNLKAWSQMEITTVQSVIHSQFVKDYRLLLAEDRQYNKYPEQLKTSIEQSKVQSIVNQTSERLEGVGD